MIREIAAADEMFTGDLEAYFSVGRSALRCINVSLMAARFQPVSIRTILDLPCGYGRVLRHLSEAFPDADITACDLLRDGVDYCAQTFGASPLYSDENPANIALEPNSFDLIWVGSLLTHLRASRWLDFLKLFQRSLRFGGLLIFSAHGREAFRRTVQEPFNYGVGGRAKAVVLFGYERYGFGYANHASSKTYGHSLSRPDWVLRQLAKFPQLRVVHFAETAWDNHHDIYACRKEASEQSDSPWTFVKRKLQRYLRTPEPRSNRSKCATHGNGALAFTTSVYSVNTLPHHQSFLGVG
jgi:Methyltransferase domain.